MRIVEVTQQLLKFRARIRIKSTTVTTAVSAESLTQARQLLQYLYGTDNVLSVGAISKRPRHEHVKFDAQHARFLRL